MYTEESINELKSKINLINVVELYTTLKKNGSSYTACCPLHDEKSPSFYIKEEASGAFFKCFGCGKGGDAIQFIQYKENCSYIDALRLIADKLNFELIEEGKQVYTLPTFSNKTELSDGIVKWFDSRKISQNTLVKAKVTEGIESMPINGNWENVNTIHFNYFRNGELVNVKYRGKNKSFKLHKGSELIFYNLDSVKGKKEVYCVEGEADCLALIEAGYDNETSGVLSVPNGASEHKNNLIYLTNCIKDLEHIERFHLGFDSDSNGRKLREEMAERLGKDRCDYIEWKNQKDANDVLKEYGIQGVIDCCSNPVKFPLEGVFTISDFQYEIEDMYKNGLDKGVSIDLPHFPLRFVKGYITVITGISGHGKSEVVDEICLRLTLKHSWKGAFYSPENKPTQLHYSKLASRLVGKAWDGPNRITKEEDMQVRNFLDRKIWFVKPEKDFALSSILKSIRDLQLRHGLDYFVIDAWNKLEHKENDTNYIGRALDELAVFCETYSIHCFLVAHPIKPETDKKTGNPSYPRLYNISGSNNFNNKADNGISVFLDRETGIATLHILKVKFKHWGFISAPEYLYEPNSGRYYTIGFPDFTNWITKQNNTSSYSDVTERNLQSFFNSPPPF